MSKKNVEMEWVETVSARKTEKTYVMNFSKVDYFAGLVKRENKRWRCYIELPDGSRHSFPLYVGTDTTEAMHAAEKRLQIFLKSKIAQSSGEEKRFISIMEEELYRSLRCRNEQKMRLATA